MRIWNCAIPDNIIIPQNEKIIDTPTPTKHGLCEIILLLDITMFWFHVNSSVCSPIISSHSQALGIRKYDGIPFVGESRHDIPFYPSYCWLNIVKSPSNIPLVWPDSHIPPTKYVPDQGRLNPPFFMGSMVATAHWLKYMGFLVTDSQISQELWNIHGMIFFWHNGCQTNWESSRHSPLNSRHKKSHGQWRIEHILTDVNIC